MATRSELQREQDQPFHVGYHVVCVLDILGQAAKLKDWTKHISGDFPSADFVEVFQKTAGTVLALRITFSDYFRAISETRATEKALPFLTADHQEIYKRFKSSPLCTQQFGDTFLFYAALVNEYSDITMIPMHHMLAACGMAMIFGLASGIPLRGSLTVGLGVEIDCDNFYGPALAEAHHIEKDISCYPRIVVSNRAVEFAKGNMRFSATPPTEPLPQIEQLNQEIARICRGLMYQDTDGCFTVDFLGKQMRALAEGDVSPVSAAYQFVQAEARRFAASEDKKLAARYRQLLNYMESRLPEWNIPIRRRQHAG